MDGLLENIGIWLIVIVGIVAKLGESSLNNRKKKGGAPMTSGDTVEYGGQEATDRTIVHSQPQSEASRSFTTTVTMPEPFLTTDINTATATTPIVKKTVKHEVVTESASTEHQLCTTKKGNITDDNNNTQIDFDLRKAVIYSEILSPKFKDYD